VTAADVVLALRGVNFRFVSEAELQEGIARVLTERGLAFEREVKLAAADRIDFLVGTVGIEVKVDGPLSALTRQIYRYAKHDRIDGLLVVSSLNRLAFGMPAAINGKPVTVHVVSRAFE
jgi:hypothetical protein